LKTLDIFVIEAYNALSKDKGVLNPPKGVQGAFFAFLEYPNPSFFVILIFSGQDQKRTLGEISYNNIYFINTIYCQKKIAHTPLWFTDSALRRGLYFFAAKSLPLRRA
jgi:hypothetical protein